MRWILAALAGETVAVWMMVELYQTGDIWIVMVPPIILGAKAISMSIDAFMGKK